MHEGRGHNGKRLYPAMPYPAYTKMTDDDVLAIRAYLTTVAPVTQRVDSQPVAVSVQYPPRDGVLELDELHAGPLSTRSGKIGGMESRRLHRRGCRAIAAPATRRRRCSAPTRAGCLCRRYAAGLVCSRYHQRSAQGHRWVVKGRLVRVLQDRHKQVDTGVRADGGRGVPFDIPNDRRGCPAIATYLKDSGTAVSGAKPEPVPPTTMRCARVRRSTRTVVRRATGIQAKVRSICFRALAGSALVQSDDPTTLAAWCCRARARSRHRQADRSRHARVRLAAERRAGGGGPDLHPEQLGKCRGSVSAGSVAGSRASLSTSP